MMMFTIYLGTMSGGGKTVLRGRMGQSVAVTSVASPQKLDQMEQKLQNLESRARQLRTRQVALEDQVTLLPQQLQTMRMNLNKYKMDIQVCSSPETFPVFKVDFVLCYVIVTCMKGYSE
jgi:chromosome segregation ATPase